MNFTTDIFSVTKLGLTYERTIGMTESGKLAFAESVRCYLVDVLVDFFLLCEQRLPFACHDVVDEETRSRPRRVLNERVVGPANT